MKKMIVALIIMSFISCEKETCPEGSVEINDSFGNFIGCSSVPKFRKTEFETKDKLLTVKNKKTNPVNQLDLEN
jgi:hypothetical protein